MSYILDALKKDALEKAQAQQGEEGLNVSTTPRRQKHTPPTWVMVAVGVFTGCQPNIFPVAKWRWTFGG